MAMRVGLSSLSRLVRSSPRLLRAGGALPRALLTPQRAVRVTFQQIETFPVIQTDSDDSVTTPPQGVPDTLRVKLSSGDMDVLAGQDLAVIELIVPGIDGANIGILPGNEYTVSRVDAGVISLKTSNTTHRFVTAGGFVHVNDNGTVVINTVACYALDDIDINLVKQELENTRQMASTGDKYAKEAAPLGIKLYEAILAAQ